MEAEPIWLQLARKEAGIHEVPGPAANKRIVWYDSFTTLSARSDEVPWCSSFVNAMIHQSRLTHPEIDPETKSAAAMSWMIWGQDLGKYPRLGCIVVFEWEGGGHHVAFYTGSGEGNIILCLGGNQHDSVKVSSYLVDDVIGYRWPNHYNQEA